MPSTPGSGKSSRRTGVTLFAKSPFRAHHIVSNTVLLLADLVTLAVIVGRYWRQLSPLGIFLFGGLTFGLVSHWYRLVKVHSEIHKRIISTDFIVPEPQADTDKAFGTVAALSFQSMLNLFGLVMLCLMAFVEILRAH